MTTASIFNKLPDSFVGIRKEFDEIEKEEIEEERYDEQEEINNLEEHIPD